MRTAIIAMSADMRFDIRVCRSCGPNVVAGAMSVQGRWRAVINELRNCGWDDEVLSGTYVATGTYCPYHCSQQKLNGRLVM